MRGRDESLIVQILKFLPGSLLKEWIGPQRSARITYGAQAMTYSYDLQYIGMTIEQPTTVTLALHDRNALFPR